MPSIIIKQTKNMTVTKSWNVHDDKCYFIDDSCKGDLAKKVIDGVSTNLCKYHTKMANLVIDVMHGNYDDGVKNYRKNVL